MATACHFKPYVQPKQSDFVMYVDLVHVCVLCLPAADFLQPDEVTFAVLLRGYGNQNPPAWQSIDTVLTTMKNTYGIEPTASE